MTTDTAIKPTSRVATAAGYVGEALIALGLLVLLFAVWQLFYTDVQADRTQERVLDELPWANTDATSTGVDVIPEEFQFRTEPPIMDVHDYATVFAVLHVPRWGADYAKPIAEGVTRKDVLDVLGLGRYPQTAMPGEFGNFAVAGHRTSYGKPLSEVDTLQVGDALIIQTDQTWYVYTVTSWSIVRPTQIEVIAPTPGVKNSEPSGRFITLTTCHPRYSAAQRWVVHGELDYWAPTGMGIPPEMVEDLT